MSTPDKINPIGGISDDPWSGFGDASVISALKTMAGGGGPSSSAANQLLEIDVLGDTALATSPKIIDPDAANADIIGLLRGNKEVFLMDPITLQRVQWGDPANEYETVAASQTAQVVGATGVIGDYIQGLLIIPATLSPGNVLLLDSATSITIFAGGTNSVSNLVPFYVPLGMASVSGAWKVTTGANVSAIAIGSFS